MKYISFTFKNIKNFIRHHPVMFLFLIVVQVICCVAVFITCGMANNMYYVEDTGKKAVDEEYLRTILFGFEEEYIDENGYRYSTSPSYSYSDDGVERSFSVYDAETGETIIDEETGRPMKVYQVKHIGCIPMGEAREKIDELVDFLQEDLETVLLMMYPDTVTDLNESNVTQILSYISGPLYEDDDMFKNSSNNIFTYPENGYEDYEIGDTITLNGVEYTYVGNDNTGYAIPYKALQDQFQLRSIYIALGEIPDEQRLSEISTKIQELFGDQLREEPVYPEPYDPLEKQLSEMVYVISIVVMIIILLAIAKFYNYILSDRKETLTILRLCGSTRSKVHIIYMLEIFITMIVTSSIGFVLFKYLFFEGIAEQYPSFVEFYTYDVYIIVFAAYIILAMIIMAFTVIPSTKDTIVDMKRRR